MTAHTNSGSTAAPTRSRRTDATGVVAFAAALWGLDGLLRKPLATALDAGTIVLWEHIIAFAALLPWLPRAVRALARCRWRERAAVVAIGVGSSAVATALFTRAFAIGAQSQDYVTPLVLQKLQPVFAIAMAVVVLHERAKPRFLLFLVPALAGAWLLTFAHPADVTVSEAEPALLALGAAALWAAGTVLGRYVGTSLAPIELTTLRYLFGLIGSFVVVLVTGDSMAPGASNLLGLVLLALIPGLLSLLLYYRALRRTPASRATLAELAFPATAAVVGVVFLGSSLTASQWLGLGIVMLAVCALGLHEGRRGSDEPAVVVATPALALSDA